MFDSHPAPTVTPTPPRRRTSARLLKGAVAVATMSLGAVTLASEATAAPPNVVLDQEFEWNSVIPAEEFECGVEATLREVGTVRRTLFFDRDGNVVRVVTKVNGTNTITTEFGEAVDRYAEVIRIDTEEGTRTINGNTWNVHAAGGGGVLVNDSGRFVVDLTTGEVVAVNGPRDTFFGNFDALCTVLGPNGEG